MRASIIIATRNRGHLLKMALDSIWAHSYEGTEVIVVDDGSTDCTESVLRSFVKWPALRTKRIERNGGYRKNPGPVYNAAHNMATGDVHIEQSAETIHLTPSVDLLVAACVPGTMVLATVFKGSPLEMRAVRAAIEDGSYVYGKEFTETRPIVVGHHRQPKRHPVYGAQTICGHDRPCPLMFLGAIHRDDWRTSGGYDHIDRIGNDQRLAEAMISRGAKFTFLTRAIGFNLDHGKT